MRFSDSSLVRKMSKRKKRTLAESVQVTTSITGFDDIVNAMVEQCQVADLRRRTDKVKVFVKAVYSKISEINTSKENYYAEVFFQARWREPILDGKTDIKKDTIKWDEFWNPKLKLDNMFREAKEKIWQTVTFNSSGEAQMYERRRIMGYFSQKMDLVRFPFDVQDLELSVASERCDYAVDIIQDPLEVSLVSQNSFVQDHEWKVYNYVDLQKRDTVKIYENSGRVIHPCVTFVIRAQRRYQFYLYNFILVLFFINSMTFTTFSVSVDKPENRIQMTFILLLSTVSFRTNINNSLPKIPYLTRMDQIILSSFVVQCSICLWHAIIAIIKRKSSSLGNPSVDPVILDRYVLLGLGLAYVGLHVLYVALIFMQTFSKSREFKEREKHSRMCDRFNE